MLLKFSSAILFKPTPKIIIISSIFANNLNCFTIEKSDNLKSQNVTSSWSGRRKLPYAFTEQGIYLVLEGELAVKQSWSLVRSFISMKDYHRKSTIHLTHKNHNGEKIMKRMSEKGKKARHRGEGIKENYKPWIHTRELTSGKGVRSSIKDPITGRTMQLLSQLELRAYLLLRWDDTVTDIREQYPLDLDATNEIAERLGFSQVGNGKIHMTTDFLVTYLDDYENGLTAISIKQDYASLTTRDKEKLVIEKTYWAERGVPFFMKYKKDLDYQLSNNLRFLWPFWSDVDVDDIDAMIKHFIITKQIKVDLTKPLDLYQIKKEFLNAKQ